MKILITGGMGFIGSALSQELVRRGHDVLVLDSLSSQIHGDLPSARPPEGVAVKRVDVRHLADHHDLLEGCDAVYHLAAETGTAQSMYRIAHYVDVNEIGTAALLEAVAKCTRRPRRLILTSSRSVYGEGAYVAEDDPSKIIQPAPRTKEKLEAGIWEPLDERGRKLKAIPTPETLRFAPGSVYAATKASQELLLQSASDALGVRSTIFRLQNVYGEGQSLQNPYTGIISIFFNRARQGLDIPVYEDGLESRDFVHISDVVAALVSALEASTPPSSVLNVGSGVPTSVSGLTAELLSASGFKVPVRVTGQFRLGDIRHCFADLTLAKKTMGYEPRMTLAEGLRRFCAWASGQPVHEDRLDQATEELRRKGLSR